jgi:hypothetical protein
METKEDIHNKILKLTVLIQEKYPELYSGLGELRDTITNKEFPEVNEENLGKYYESLRALVERYIEEKDKKNLYQIKHI